MRNHRLLETAIALLATFLVAACATSSGESTSETSGESSASSGSSADSESESRSETDEIPGQYAVVPRSATFYSSPSSDADQTWSGDGDGYYTFRATDWGDEWVELQPPEDSEGVCWPTPVILEDLELVVYVKRDAVHPVLAEAVERQYEDGTSVKLSAGLPVERQSGERSIVNSPRFDIPLERRDLSTSEGFDSSAPLEVGDAQVVRAKNGVEIGGNVLPGSKGAAFPTEGKPAGGTEASHRIVTNCLELHARVRDTENLGRGLNAALAASPSFRRNIVRAKAASSSGYVTTGSAELSWPDGERAGEAAGDEAFLGNEVTFRRDERQCFEGSFGPSLLDSNPSPEPFVVCIDEEKTRKKSPAAAAAAMSGESAGSTHGTEKADKKIGSKEERKVSVVADTERLDTDGDCPADSNFDAVFESKEVAIQYCYEKQHQLNPDLEGTARYEFTIDDDGAVGSVSVVEETLGSEKMVSCLSRLIERMRFERTAEDGEICTATYRTAFESKEPEED